MSARKSVCMLSAGALLAIAAPAFAERDGPGHRHYHRNDDRDFALERRHRVREAVVRRPAVVERRVVVERPVYVERRVVVERPVYVERPVVVERPVYVERPVAAPQYPPYYGEPAYNESYYGSPPAQSGPNPVGAIGGAVIGAAIGSQVGHGDGRVAATAIGAVVGGIIGSGF